MTREQKIKAQATRIKTAFLNYKSRRRTKKLEGYSLEPELTFQQFEVFYKSAKIHGVKGIARFIADSQITITFVEGRRIKKLLIDQREKEIEEEMKENEGKRPRNEFKNYTIKEIIGLYNESSRETVYDQIFEFYSQNEEGDEYEESRIAYDEIFNPKKADSRKRRKAQRAQNTTG